MRADVFIDTNFNIIKFEEIYFSIFLAANYYEACYLRVLFS